MINNYYQLYIDSVFSLAHTLSVKFEQAASAINNKVIMEHVRRSARLLASENQIEITQSGKVVDPLSFRGPIRLKLK